MEIGLSAPGLTAGPLVRPATQRVSCKHAYEGRSVAAWGLRPMAPHQAPRAGAGVAAQGSIRSGSWSPGSVCPPAAMLPGDVVVTARWLSRNQVHSAGMADKGRVVGVAMRYVCQLVPLG